MKALIAFCLGLLVVVGGVVSLEYWCYLQIQKKNLRLRDISGILNVHELKKLYPEGIYPDPPKEIPERKRFKGPYTYHLPKTPEQILLNDSRFHKDSNRYILRRSGKVLSDVNFYYDKFRRRLTPANEMKKNADYSVAFLGDSNIAGFGLQQEDTLSNYLSLNLPQTKVYNYAAPGLYPHEIMNIAEKINPAEEMPEKNGVALYFILSYHMLRNIGALREVVQPYSHKKKVVSLDDNGELVVGGTYKEEMPFRCWSASYLLDSWIFRYFQLDLKVGEKGLRTTTAIIKKMQKSMEAKGKKFYVVIHPFQPLLEDTQALLPYLVKEKIPFIYFGHWRMHRYTEEPTTLIFDMHVSKAFNRILADGLSRVLKNDLSVVK